MTADRGEATGIRRADPAARRRGLQLILIALVVGAAAFLAASRYGPALRDWILADRGQSAQRIAMLTLGLALLLLLPLLALAARLWTIAGATALAQEYPPPGLRVVRDTRVVTGHAAKARSRQLKWLACFFAIAAAAVGLLLWRVASMLMGAVG